ncbi:TonB-dependent receptor domain-containing protein [Steroidobacter flavus]|uniref:TonB-dependent receptor domain-containing protein n=1 Tax=Steroidobacter flavus TaxID=1842136 RepID=A0ABV8T2J9_9GAMM
MNRACGSLCALLIALGFLAAKAESSRMAFRIPSQPLDEALLALAQQAGLQLAAVGDLDRATRSGEVSGVMTVEAALRRLLAGSGYRFELRRDGVVSVTAAERPRRATAASEHELAAPPVNTLATVVVSARRRDERWIEVPIAVSIADAADLEKLGTTNATEALHLMPGVSAVDAGSSFTQVQIRGISSSLAGNDNGYYFDDVPFSGVTVPWHPETRAFDLDRVEVLKGPQGTLFGEGSMGGTVRIFTHAPELNRFGAHAALTATATEGGEQGGSGKLMINAPLVPDRLALRVVATREALPGWIDVPEGDRDVNEQRIETERVRARWSASDRWMTDVSFASSTTTAHGGDYGANDNLQSLGFLDTRVQWRSSMLATHYDLIASRLSLVHSEAQMTDAMVGDLDPASSLDGSLNIETENTELRWASTHGSRWDWLLGFAHRRASRSENLRVNEVRSEGTQSNQANAAFGEVTVRPGGPWSVAAGLRYFTEDVVAQGTSEQMSRRMDTSFHRLIPRFSVSRQVSSQRLLYASVATGFRSGQMQPVASLVRAQRVGMEVPATLSPDTLVSYELGLKQVLAEGRVRMQWAAFYSRWHDLPVRVPIDDTINALTNSGGARIRGTELDLRYTPLGNLDLGLSATYVDARYAADVPGTPLHEGTPVYNVPPLSLSGTMSYGWRLSDMTASVAASARYHSRRQTGLVVSSGGDAIAELNLRLGLESPSGWGWYLQGDNLTDEAGAVDGRTTFGRATRLHPRSVAIELQYRY